MLHYDVASLWEIAHRWYDIDPQHSDPKKLPLDVQDILRFLTHEFESLNYPLSSNNGSLYKAYSYLPKYENFIVPDHMRYETRIDKETGAEITIKPDKPLPPITEAEKRDLYFGYTNDILERQRQATDGFDQCYKYSIFDKELLSTRYSTQDVIYQMCRDHHKAFPSFWFDDHTIKEMSEFYDKDSNPEPAKRMTANQIDRELCRAIAQTLWDIDPAITISAMAKHQSIQKYGNAALYKGENTLRDWIKDLQPKDHKKPGRPSKKPP